MNQGIQCAVGVFTSGVQFGIGQYAFVLTIDPKCPFFRRGTFRCLKIEFAGGIGIVTGKKCHRDGHCSEQEKVLSHILKPVEIELETKLPDRRPSW